MRWRNVYIFISSTFNDMHAERDYLVKNVFPELAEWCEARKLRLVDVDLRWGVTSADSMANNTVLTCLRNIDECRPFFLCFLGQRRGWVPRPGEIGASTISSYPDLPRYIGKTSVTEMEIEHALLSPMRRIVDEREDTPAPASHALFFFRNDGFTHLLTDGQKRIYTNAAEEDVASADRALSVFKEKVIARWTNVTNYDCRWDERTVTTELLTEGPEASQGRLVDFLADGRPLRDVVIGKLKAEIDREFPDHETALAQSTLEAGLEQQAHFIEQNRYGFIPRSGDFDALVEYVDGDHNGIFVLTAPAGLGKTMLLANFTRRLLSERHKVYARFCGASDLTVDTYGVWKSIFDEAGVVSPPALDEMRQNIVRLLETLASLGPCVILIDAINQLPGGLDMCEWLPRKLPNGLRLIVSLKDDETSLPLMARLAEDASVMMSSVRPFGDDADKRALIASFLERYLKALDDEHISAICDLPASENPLYLKVVLSELRVFGAFKQLEEEIGRFGKSPLEAFDSLLRRLETDEAYSPIAPRNAVPFLFGLLACARKGLSEDELVFCFRREFAGVSDDGIRHTIRLFVRQVRPFLARREGRADFLYESFMLAARDRYSSRSRYLHAHLAECFRSHADSGGDSRYEGKSARAFDELPYHLHNAGRDVDLASMLCDYLWIYHKSRLCGVDGVIPDYEYVGGDHAITGLRMVRDSLVLSAHILRSDLDQMPSQLWGRMAHLEHVEVRNLLEGAVRETKRTWIRPIDVCMDPPGGALRKTVTGQRGGVGRLLLTEEGLYSGAGDGSVWMWDPDKWEQRVSLKGHTGAIGDMVANGGRVYSTSWDGTLRVWNSRSGECVARWRIATSYGDGGRLALWDGKLVLHAGGEFTVWSMDRYSGAPERTFEGYPERVADMVVRGDLLFVAPMRIPGRSTDFKIAVWDLPSGTCVGYLSGHAAGVTRLLAVGDRLISASQDKTIRLWDIGSRSCVRILTGHSDTVTQLVMMNDTLISCSSDKSFRLWDLSNGQCLQVFDQVGTPPQDCLALGQSLITSATSGEIRVWDLGRSRSGRTTNAESALTVQGDDCVICALKDSTIRVDGYRGNLLHVLRGHSALITALHYHRGCLFSGDYDGKVKMWDPKTGECLKAYSAEGGRIDSLLLGGDCLVVIVHSQIECLRIGSWKKLWKVDRRGILKTVLHEGRLFIATQIEITASDRPERRYLTEAIDVETGSLLYSIETGEPADLCGNESELISVEYGRFHKECDIVVRDSADGSVRRTIPVSRPEDTDGRYTSVTVWKASVVGGRIYLSLSDKKRSNRISVWNLDTGDHIVTTDALGHGVTETAETGRLLWGRVVEIVSRRDFTVLWDTLTDEPFCRFCCDSSLHLYESGREMIGYRNGEPVRFALENWSART